MTDPENAEDMLREMLQLGDCGNDYRSAVEAVLGLVELLRRENEQLEAKLSKLDDDVLEHKDACGHLRAALVGRGLEIDAMRAENATLCEQLALKTQANEDAQAQLVVYDKLIVGVAGGELDWFRRREECGIGWADWERDNPKPGAGT